MNMGDKSEKAAKTVNTRATDTADIKKLTQIVLDLTVQVDEMKITVTRTAGDLAFTVENALVAMDKATGQAEDAAMAVRTVLTDGASIPGLSETTAYLRQIEHKLTEANLGPSNAKMEELMNEPLALMKRMGMESLHILSMADWRTMGIVIATGLTITAIQGVAVIAAKASGFL